MNRESGISRLQNETFDILVVGGGATGLGCAVDAASRGYRTGLIEQADFASATSSRSTKLIHGGVRYLQQGNIALVREALLERSRLLRNAPNLVKPLAFVLPTLAWWELPYYGGGLRLYDALARSSDMPRAQIVGAAAALQLFPSLQPQRVRRAAVYWDAHFDDARLAIALAQTAVDHGAAVANYIRAERFLYENGRIAGVAARDIERDVCYEVRAKAVVNATGIFADELRTRDDPQATSLLTFSRGSHIVVSAGTLPIAKTALLIPRTSDGRVLFAVPWQGAVLIGTTDVKADHAESDPAASPSEIEYLIATVNHYVPRGLTRGDVRTAFAGLRPLVSRAAVRTARLSREHVINVSPSGLVTITGGKWTTYRKMAEDTIDKTREVAGLVRAPCRTYDLPLHDAAGEPEFAYAIEHEMARTLEDLLARRRRTLFVDAAAARRQAAAALAPLCELLGRDVSWAQTERRRFDALAARFGGLPAGETRL